MYLDVNERGDAVITWDQSDGSARSCFAGTYEAATGVWSSQQKIESVVDETCWMRGAKIAHDGRAAAFITIADGSGTGYDEVPHFVPFVPAGLPGAGWQTPVPMQVDSGEIADYALDKARTGHFVATYVFINDISYAGSVRAARYATSTGLVEEILLSAALVPELDGASFASSVTPAGHMLVAWTERDQGIDDIMRAAVVGPGSERATNLLVRRVGATEEIEHVAVAAAPGGGGLIVWAESDPVLGGDTRRLPSLRLGAGGQLDTVSYQNAAPGDVAASPKARLDETGMGVLVWRQADSVTDDRDLRYRLLR